MFYSHNENFRVRKNKLIYINMILGKSIYTLTIG